jgi:hypothetical protein
VVGNFVGVIEGSSVVGNFDGKFVGSSVEGDKDGEVEGSSAVGDNDGDLEGLLVDGDKVGCPVSKQVMQTFVYLTFRSLAWIQVLSFGMMNSLCAESSV